jgi:hypothetical protein
MLSLKWRVREDKRHVLIGSVARWLRHLLAFKNIKRKHIFSLSAMIWWELAMKRFRQQACPKGLLLQSWEELGFVVSLRLLHIDLPVWQLIPLAFRLLLVEYSFLSRFSCEPFLAAFDALGCFLLPLLWHFDWQLFQLAICFPPVHDVLVHENASRIYEDPRWLSQFIKSLSVWLS